MAPKWIRQITEDIIYKSYTDMDDTRSLMTENKTGQKQVYSDDLYNAL